MEIVKRFQAIDPIMKWSTAAIVVFEAVVLTSLYIASRRLRASHIPLPPIVIDWNALQKRYPNRTDLKRLADDQLVVGQTIHQILWGFFHRSKDSQSAWRKTVMDKWDFSLDDKKYLYEILYDNKLQPIQKLIQKHASKWLCCINQVS